MSKEIILKSLMLRNFKGVKELKVDFGMATDIYGDNGTGKTTIFDAFTWLLFDKDSCDRKSFEIKTLGSNNEVFHGLDHEVTGVISVDDRELKLCKLHREKWTKRKGEAEKMLTGNETLYYIDDVPVKQWEYQEKVGGIIDENIFKLITNPMYFSANMKWQDRRKVLLGIIGDIDMKKVFNHKSSLRPLEKLLCDKDIETLKRSLAARKKKLNEGIKEIPSRIDEINKSIQDIDYSTAELQLQEYEAALAEIEDKLMNFYKAQESQLKQRYKLYALGNDIKNLELKTENETQEPLKKLYSQLDEIDREISKVESQCSKISFQIENKQYESAEIEKQLIEMRECYRKVNEEKLVIPEDSFICPTCRRSFEPKDIESKRTYMQDNFNKGKTKKLTEINSMGKTKREKKEKLDNDVQALKKEIEALNVKLTELKSKRVETADSIDNFKPIVNLENNEEYQILKSEFDALKETIVEPLEDEKEINILKEQRAEFTKNIDVCKKALALKEQNGRFKDRIKELMEEEKSLAEQIQQLEGQEILCDDFIKTKVELLESGINSKFEYVTFKLFNSLINGAVEECCEALINGVPFGNANTAGRINGGLDIINTLSQHYGISAPIFIDNRESINDIIDCSSQIINLIVSRDTKLRTEIQKDDEVMETSFQGPDF